MANRKISGPGISHSPAGITINKPQALSVNNKIHIMVVAYDSATASYSWLQVFPFYNGTQIGWGTTDCSLWGDPATLGNTNPNVSSANPTGGYSITGNSAYPSSNSNSANHLLCVEMTGQKVWTGQPTGILTGGNVQLGSTGIYPVGPVEATIIPISSNSDWGSSGNQCVTALAFSNPFPNSPFFAQVGTYTGTVGGSSSNIFTYAWTEVYLSGVWTTLTGGRSSTNTGIQAYNMLEVPNNPSGLQGNGTTIANLSGSMAIQPVVTGDIVLMYEFLGSNGLPFVYWFNSSQGIDGTC